MVGTNLRKEYFRMTKIVINEESLMQSFGILQ